MPLSNKTKKVLYTSFASLVLIAIAFFFGKEVYVLWDNISVLNFNYFYLFLSFFVWLTALLLLAIAYHFIIVKLGAKSTFFKTAKARAFSDLGSYVPGKIVPLLTRLHYLKGYASRTQIITSSFIETTAVILSSIFAFALIYFLQPGIFAKYSLVAFVAFPLCMVSMHPKIISFAINFGLKLLKKEPIEIKLKYMDIMNACLIYSAYWIFSGIAVFLIIIAVYPLNISYFPYVMAGYAVAWVIGFLSVIVPAGIGVKEGVLAYLLAMYMPLSVAIAASLGARLLMTIAHLMFMLLFAKR